jgi:type IV secretory pathway VirB2 component (pilin)
MATPDRGRVYGRYVVGLPPYDPPGGTPAGPPASCKSKTRGSLRDTSLNGARGWPRSRQRLHASMRQAAITITAVISSCTPAGAAGSGMPWESPLTRILESIEGPVAKVCAVVIIIVTGLSLAFGDMSGGFRRLVQVVFGLSIAFAATSFFLSFFSFAGGALIE